MLVPSIMPVQLMSVGCPESILKSNESESGFLIGVVLTGNYSGRHLQCHTGFVIRDNSRGQTIFHLLHFSCDRTLTLETLNGDYGFLWLKFIKPSSIDHLIAEFNNIYLKNQKTIPYGINYNVESPYFDKEGNKITEEGLTCATFVMELLQRNGIKLLKVDDWPSDPQWQGLIVNHFLPAPPVNTMDFLNAQYQAIGISPRFTPQQVVGGCHYFEKDPLDFNFIEVKAVPETLDELKRLGILV